MYRQCHVSGGGKIIEMTVFLRSCPSAYVPLTISEAIDSSVSKFILREDKYKFNWSKKYASRLPALTDEKPKPANVILFSNHSFKNRSGHSLIFLVSGG